MAEYIPVAPSAKLEGPPEALAEDMAPAPGGEKRKVLDQSQILPELLDEDILSDIESRLEGEEGPGGDKPVGEKVELDKADLPMLDAIIPPPVAEDQVAEVEVDLAGEGEEPAPAEPAPEEPKGRKKLILISAGVAVLMLAAGVALWFTLLAPKRQVTVVDQPQTTFTDKIPDPRLALRLDLEPFMVPLVKSEQGRLLLVGVSLEVSDPAEKDLLIPYKTQIRDAIYRALRDRPAQEIHNARAKNLLQAQIKTELNHLLGSVIIYQVYFTDFVISG